MTNFQVRSLLVVELHDARKCAPLADFGMTDRIQMLMHGLTYTSAYWTWPYNGFQNYSYVGYSCEHGLTSFAFDAPGAGHSTIPHNSTDVQLPVLAEVAVSLSAMLRNGTLAKAFNVHGSRGWDRVIGVGHSLGSAAMNWAAITLGSTTPFDAIIASSLLHTPSGIVTPPNPFFPARDVSPSKWGGLDPGYITTSNISDRAGFYSTDNSTFSPEILMIDELTKDIGSIWSFDQLGNLFQPARGFEAPVAVVIGQGDQFQQCNRPANNFLPCTDDEVLMLEQPFWPDSRNLTAFVIESTGHDLNLHFSARGTFALFHKLVTQAL
jgi:hypothetical protein